MVVSVVYPVTLVTKPLRNSYFYLLAWERPENMAVCRAGFGNCWICISYSRWLCVLYTHLKLIRINTLSSDECFLYVETRVKAHNFLVPVVDILKECIYPCNYYRTENFSLFDWNTISTYLCESKSLRWGHIESCMKWSQLIIVPLICGPNCQPSLSADSKVR